MENKIRLSGMLHESLANGPGIRRVLFAQGCKHNCKGCFNTHTHSFECGQLVDLDKIVDAIRINPMLRGVTFSGGDPLEQAEEFGSLARKIKELNKDIWCYTGYTYEFIAENSLKRVGFKEILENIDVLVDGKFEEDKKNENLRFRGSTNQRIIDVKKSLKTNQVVIFEC